MLKYLYSCQLMLKRNLNVPLNATLVMLWIPDVYVTIKKDTVPFYEITHIFSLIQTFYG